MKSTRPIVCGVRSDVGLICPYVLLAHSSIELWLAEPDELFYPKSHVSIALVGVFEDEAEELRMGDLLATISLDREFEREFLCKRIWPLPHAFTVFVRNRGEQETLEVVQKLIDFVEGECRCTTTLSQYVGSYDSTYFVEWLRQIRSAIHKTDPIYY